MSEQLIPVILSHLQNGSEVLLSHQNYSFRKLISSHAKEAAELILNEFVQHNPLIRAFNIKFPNEREKILPLFRKYWEMSAQQSCNQQMAIGCFDTSKNNELVGVMINKDAISIPSGPSSNNLSENSSILIFDEVYEELVRRSDEQCQSLLTERNTVMRSLVAIKSKHGGKNIAIRMYIASQCLGWTKGFKYSLINSSNVKSAAMAKKGGLQKISELNVKEFQTKGVRHFQNIDEENQLPNLWIKKLNFDSLATPSNQN